MHHPRHAALALLLCLTALGCGAEATLAGPGDPCAEAAECASGLCVETCRDPASDDDLDGLTNAVEGTLGTHLGVADTDGDGANDGTEVGDDLTAPRDTDGDGIIDALEADTADTDGDCISDQRDAVNDVPEEDLMVIGDTSCCCGGGCAALGVQVLSVSCEVDRTGEPVLVCDTDGADTDGDGIIDPCDADAP